MTNKRKHKEDKRNVKESTNRESLNSAAPIGFKRLVKTESEIIMDALLNDKSLAEIKEKSKLTDSRIKQIFQRAIVRLNSYFDTIEERITNYLEVEKNYAGMEHRPAKYEKIEQGARIAGKKFNSLPFQTQALLNTKITDTEFSRRIKNFCHSGHPWGNKIETVADLVRLNVSAIKQYRNCGRKSILEIEDFFHRHHLSWGMLD
ncbi:MAG: hypothetical protein JST26_05720 [Bacteroidetes bacterium]|nr:hypothetical protein [Bacteroidota bacterium]